MSDSKTNITTPKGDLLNATDFGRLVGCSFQAVKRMMGTKLTEGISFIKEDNKILIDVDQARNELRANVDPATCKNEKLLQWLDLDKTKGVNLAGAENDEVAQMDEKQVREQMNKSLLRLSLMEEKVMNGKFVEREIVNRNLESFGMEIRNNFSNISAKITPRMRAAATDKEAELMLGAEIEEILMGLSNLGTRDIAVK